MLAEVFVLRSFTLKITKVSELTPDENSKICKEFWSDDEHFVSGVSIFFGAVDEFMAGQKNSRYINERDKQARLY